MGNIKDQLTSMGHKVRIGKDGHVYDSTGKPVFTVGGNYYVMYKGLRLYFTNNGKFTRTAPKTEKGFFEQVGDKIESVASSVGSGIKLFATKMGEISPLSERAFVPAGSLKIVDLSKTASGVPIRTHNGSYRTPSEEDKKTARKLLGILGAAAVAAPAAIDVAPAVVQTVGQALTPSTWVGGISLAFGYQTPQWILNAVDLGASAYWANRAGNEIDKHGLNLETGLNAALSLAPITKDQRAINAVGTGLRDAIKSTKNLAESVTRPAVNRSINLLNGVTNSSKSSTEIASSPFVRTWTNKPNYTLETNPTSYTITESNNNILEDRSLSIPTSIVPEGIRLPDGTYSPVMMDSHRTFADLEEYFQDWNIKNQPDGLQGVAFRQNGVDFMIGKYPELPNVWYVLSPRTGNWLFFSKNDYDYPLLAAKEHVLKLRNDMINKIDYPALLMIKKSKVTPDREDAYNNDINVEGTEEGMYMMNSLQDDIDWVYLSPNYIDRFMRHLGGSVKREDVAAKIKSDLQAVKDKTKPVLFKHPSSNNGASWSSHKSGEQQFFVGFNTYQLMPYLNFWDSTLAHEFGHMIYRSNTPTSLFISKTNQDLLSDIKDHVIYTPIDDSDKKYIEYITNPEEFRLRMFEAIRYGIRYGLTPEQIYNSPIMYKNLLKGFFDKDYLIKMLGLMLGTTPVVINNDNTK